MNTLILDNYDSFAYNLYQLVGELGGEPLVVRNDAITLEGIRRLAPRRLIISPGPGSPEIPAYFGICRQVILELGAFLPILGVCLGHQGIAYAFGARVVRADEVMHGKTSPVEHDGDPLFSGVPTTFWAMRYHSLVVDPTTVPSCLSVIARGSGGMVMALRHRSQPTLGVQFHPESIGTPHGRTILGNFLALAPAKEDPR